MKNQTIAFSADVSILAADEEHKGPRRFEALGYTGDSITVEGFDLPIVLDLATLSDRKSMIANLDHDRSKRVGNAHAHNDGKELRFSGLASAATPARDEVVNSADAGFAWQASIEASKGSKGTIQTIKAGKNVTINGRTIEGPVYVLRNWVNAGFAFVSLGADDNTSVSIAATAASHREFKMEPKFKEWLEARGWNTDELADDKQTELKAKFDAENKPAPTTVKAAGTIDEIVEARRKENIRQENISLIAAKFMDLFPGQLNSIEAHARAAIENKTDPDQFELLMLRAGFDSRPQGSNFKISAGRNERLNSEVLEAAICQSGGLRNLEKKFSEPVLEAAHREFKGRIGLNQAFFTAAELNGYRNRNHGSEVTAEVHNAACQLEPQLRANFSTISIPGILSATANKFLLDGWGSGDMAWEQITSFKSVKNFQTHTSYKLSGTMKYLKVGAGGELKHGTVAEDTYTNKADTYGRMFSITRNDLINDDLGAITQIPREMGFGANDAFNEVFYTELLDNSTFFATGNANVSTGGGSALGIAGLTAAELVFMNQTKPNGTPLGLMPSILLVPPALYRTALALMTASSVVSTTTANTPLPDANTFAGNYRVVTSPFMSNAAFTGYSAAAWYLLAEPSRMAIIETALLNGNRSPVIEQAEAAFNVLGVQMRAYHDFGVNLQEYRAGVRSNGS